MTCDERWCVVTGGRGFTTRHLVLMLIRQNIFHVRIADLGPTINLEPSESNGVLADALNFDRVEYISIDLRCKDQVLQGTKNVIDACVKQKVKRLIYTSSPSVVFDRVHGIIDGDDLLASNLLHTPSSIFGPGDRLLVPSLVVAARAGKSKFIIGDGNNIYDFTYVENVAHAHICAERALAFEGTAAEKAAGQAYFITNMEPIKFWEFISLILEGLGYERPRIKIPTAVMMPIAHVVESTYKLLGPYGMKVPQLTPSRIRLLSCTRSFKSSKPQDRIGYTPLISLQEGLKRTIESYPHLRAEHRPKREGPSKASVYLGSGRVADALLWKDKTETFKALLVLIAIYYNFIGSKAKIITVISKSLMFTSIFMFISGNLPEMILGYKLEKLQSSHFHFSEETSQQIAASVVSSWNISVKTLKSLGKGNDCILFLKAAVSLLVLSFLGAFSLQNSFIIVSTAFLAFYVYEKQEEKIDAMVLEAFSCGRKLKSNILRKFSTSKRIE
ncbi:putative 3-beta-hydroxysteroid-4-alpha-carboxylate 3-dehydrogenase (decarboxylating) [Rosa chinensis]|uniref:Reticulon-like protein n=1 Tax=Rosa chinensis TaxID=74649 RepID=A0A2P6QUG2_ROSCH|nr:putative 3-beta-hydroxysteroid-4-alpha-carboxylate 3-dehydrogenase (decarboxylating) [Rosa chinensis]